MILSGVPALYNPNERPPAAFTIGGWTICLDCGKELYRDWQEMSVPAEIPTRYEALVALATEIAES